jgi:serine/threonine protein phosphatase 1
MTAPDLGSESGSDEGRLLCIGDIHGSARELAILLGAVDPRPEDRLVFLGDYVDRGPASDEVISLLVDLQARLPGTVFLRGNHEEMMMDFLGMEGARGSIFLRAGGASTVASYGMDPEAATPEKFRAVLPEAHRRFLAESLQLHHQEGDYLFVHAGVRPGIPLADQHRDDLLWIREEFLGQRHGLPQTVVFGHTPQRAAVFSRLGWIAMDTGCCYGGLLSCLDLTGGVLHEIRRDEDAVGARQVGDKIMIAAGQEAAAGF